MVKIDDSDLNPDFEEDEEKTTKEPLALVVPPALVLDFTQTKTEEPSLPVPSGTVKQEASKVEDKVKTGEKVIRDNRKGISAVFAMLKSQNFASPVRASPLPDTHDVEFDQEYTEVIGEALEIIQRYKEEGLPDMAVAHADAQKLQALVVYLSVFLGRAQSNFGHLERSIDGVRAEHFVRAKQAAQDSGVRLTDMDAKEIARAMSNDHIAAVGIAEVYFRHLYNIYMALVGFVQVLDHTASREYKANFDQSKRN